MLPKLLAKGAPGSLNEDVVVSGDLVGGWTNPFRKIFVKLDHVPRLGYIYIYKNKQNLWNHHQVIMVLVPFLLLFLLLY